MRIQLNPAGTHFMEITDEHLRTIRKYSLFSGLIDSNGYIDEAVVSKLKLNVRAIIGSSVEDVKDLLRLAADVVYNDRMKAYGLGQLVRLYTSWSNEHKEEPEAPDPEESAERQ